MTCLQDGTEASAVRKGDLVPRRTGTKISVWMAPKGKGKTKRGQGKLQKLLPQVREFGTSGGREVTAGF